MISDLPKVHWNLKNQLGDICKEYRGEFEEVALRDLCHSIMRKLDQDGYFILAAYTDPPKGMVTIVYRKR